MTDNKKEAFKQQQKTKNAIDYIRESSLYTDPKYVWLKPLVEKVLSDNFHIADIKMVVDQIIPPDESDESSSILQKKDVEQNIIDSSPSKTATLKQIKSIDLITNVGLVSRDKPIGLNNNLNIFYGQNGSGKSSLYLALCKAIGKSKKKVIPNIHIQDQKAVCKIKYINYCDEEKDLSWQTGQENMPLPAMVFDSSICNYLVEDDQENHFRLAHLKTEYFKFLQQRYAELDEAINGQRISLKEKLFNAEASLKEKMPYLFNPAIEIKKDLIDKVVFTSEEEKELKLRKKDIGFIVQNTSTAVLKNFQNSFSKIDEILTTFAVKYIDPDSKAIIWKTKYNWAYFENINSKIKSYKVNKNALESEAKISDYITNDWINNELWIEFINKSFSFLNSLSEIEKKQYTDNVCLYCQQPLASDKTKSLFKAYKKIQEAQTSNLQRIDTDIHAVIKDMQNAISTLDRIEVMNLTIEQELENVRGEAQKIESNQQIVHDILKKYSDLIFKQLVIEKNEAQLKDINKFVNLYSVLHAEFSARIKSIEELIKNAKTQLASLQANVNELTKKQTMADNKQNLSQYLKLSNIISELENKIRDLAAIKKLTSTLETKYSNESQLKEFTEKLKREYDELEFTPSDKWRISSITPGGINKRVFNLGNWRLAEIFSEGEKKIHALADFFSQAEIDEFQGVYIFDDPVNSLDEQNIDSVAHRIKKLVGKGNQVIVFTHNLIFLNCLIRQGKTKINKLSKYKMTIFIEDDVKIDDTAALISAKRKLIKERINKFDSRAQKGEQISDIELEEAYGLMSGCVEDFVEKEILKGVIGRYRPNIRMEAISDLKNIDNAKIDNASNIYSKTSLYGTRHSKPEGAPRPSLEKLQKDFLQFESIFKEK